MDSMSDQKPQIIPFQEEAGSGVVVSSRIRIARNLAGRSFPGWQDVDGRLEVWNSVRPVLENMEWMKGGLMYKADELPELEAHVLYERHLISRDMMSRGEGSGGAVSSDEHISVMVNEEDHLRMQVLRPGLQLRSLWAIAEELDDAVERELRYAYSEELGYLTSCPTNVGTGLRASAMLHLPGLVLMKEMKPIVNGLGKIGIAVRGLWGEGTDAVGNMFQISNQATLGEAEEVIISDLEQIVLELVRHERNARQRLIESKELVLKDHIGRAAGLLRSAWLMTSHEGLNLLSALRLGIDMGLIEHVTRKLVDEQMIAIQPAHLQQLQNSRLTVTDRDAVRARVLRTCLGRLTISWEKKG